MTKTIQKTLDLIHPVSKQDLDLAQSHLDSLTKPPGSLGRLEEMAQRYAAIKGIKNPSIHKKTIFVFAADHGVVSEGVSAFPAEVTPQMVLNFLKGGAGVNVLARHAGAEVVVVDMGVNFKFDPCDGLLDRKIGHGTKNMAEGPSMTREQAETGLNTGITLAEEWISKGTDVLGTGDMGIGNTTASSAIMSVYDDGNIKNNTGRGTGISDQALNHKISVIEKALKVNQPDPDDPVDVLAKVGGFEIAGIAGLILGAAANKTPVVIDGFISGAGAVIAMKLNDTVKDYIFPSHKSVEPGHQNFFQLLGHEPLFDLQMRLGEGTGAALAINLLEASVKIYTEMATFKSAGVSAKS